MTLEDFLRKLEDSDKFVFMNYNSVDDFLNVKDDFSYLIIRPNDLDDFQIIVTKVNSEYEIKAVINNEDADEMNYRVTVKNEQQLQTFLNMTINSLKQFGLYKKYAKSLEEMC